PARKAAFIIVRSTMSPSACTRCGTGSPMCCSAARSGGLGPVYPLDPIENLAEVPLRNLNVIVVLQIQPKLCRRPKCLGQAKRSIGGDAGLFGGDSLNPRTGQTASLCKSAR